MNDFSNRLRRWDASGGCILSIEMSCRYPSEKQFMHLENDPEWNRTLRCISSSRVQTRFKGKVWCSHFTLNTPRKDPCAKCTPPWHTRSEGSSRPITSEGNFVGLSEGEIIFDISSTMFLRSHTEQTFSSAVNQCMAQCTGFSPNEFPHIAISKPMNQDTIEQMSETQIRMEVADLFAGYLTNIDDINHSPILI